MKFMKRVGLILLLIIASSFAAEVLIAHGSRTYTDGLWTINSGGSYPNNVDVNVRYNFNYNIYVDSSRVVRAGVVCPNSNLRVGIIDQSQEYHLQNVLFQGYIDESEGIAGTGDYSISNSNAFADIYLTTDTVDNSGGASYSKGDKNSYESYSDKWYGSTSNIVIRRGSSDNTNYYSTGQHILIYLTADLAGRIGSNNLIFTDSSEKSATFNSGNSLGNRNVPFSITGLDRGYVLVGAGMHGDTNNVRILEMDTGAFSDVDSASFSLGYTVDNRVSRVIFSGANPNQMGSSRELINIRVNNTGDVPMQVYRVDINNGYEASIDASSEDTIINPGESREIGVNVNMTETSNGAFDIILWFKPTILDCYGQPLDNRSVTAHITIPVPNLNNEITGDSFVLQPPPGSNITADYTGIIHIEPDIGQQPFNSTLKIVEMDGNGSSTTILNEEKEFQRGNNPEDYEWPFQINCSGDNFKIFRVTLVGDIYNNIQESNENDNTVQRDIICMGALSCDSMPREILLVPGFNTRSDVYCGFNVYDETPMVCDSAPEVVEDSNYTALTKIADIFSGLDTTSFLIFSQRLDATLDEGEIRNYTISITIPDQTRTITALNETGGEEEQTENIDYRCNVKVDVYNAPCSYYI